MRTIEFKGVKVQYDEKLPHSWKWQKKLASGNSAAGIAAIEELLLGKDEEVADALGGEMETMGELVAAIVDANDKAKN